MTDEGLIREEDSITQLRIPKKVQDDCSVEAMPRRIFANAHTYHINSISVNSDDCTYLSADDLRVNVWHLEITDQSFSILSMNDISYLKNGRVFFTQIIKLKAILSNWSRCSCRIDHLISFCMASSEEC